MSDEVVRGDRVESIADLFRFLRRGREYLVEADRRLRNGGTVEEEAASAAWYALMDAGDEWTGVTADAHVACTLDIILFFDEHPEVAECYDNKIFLIDGAWQRLLITDTIEELRKDAATMCTRLAQRQVRH